MILSAYHFDGEPETLMAAHRRMMDLFPPSGLDLHIAVTDDRSLTIYDACPDRPTHEAFVASPEFRGALAEAGLPSPTIEVLGDVHFAHLRQSVLRCRRSSLASPPSWRRWTRRDRPSSCAGGR